MVSVPQITPPSQIQKIKYHNIVTCNLYLVSNTIKIQISRLVQSKTVNNFILHLSQSKQNNIKDFPHTFKIPSTNFSLQLLITCLFFFTTNQLTGHFSLSHPLIPPSTHTHPYIHMCRQAKAKRTMEEIYIYCVLQYT